MLCALVAAVAAAAVIRRRLPRLYLAVAVEVAHHGLMLGMTPLIWERLNPIP